MSKTSHHQLAIPLGLPFLLAVCVLFSAAPIKAEERNSIPNPAAAYAAKLGYKQ